MPTIEDIKITTFDKGDSILLKVLDKMAVSPPLLPPSILCQPQTNTQSQILSYIDSIEAFANKLQK
jgi:hypothetical protein